MNPPNRYVGFTLATVSGCLWFLAVTPFDLAALAWVAAVPALLAIDKAPTLKGALFLGWWAGVVETAGGFYWVIDMMQRFAHFPWIAAALVLLLFCATRAAIFLLFAGVVYGIRSSLPGRSPAGHRAVPMALLAPLVMVICEFVVPQLFPSGQWISQAWHPLVIQITELTGPLGVTALLMLVNGALYDVLSRSPAAFLGVVSAATLLGATLVFGAVRMRQIDSLTAKAPRLRVGLVQPNFAYTNDGEFSRAEALRQLTALQDQSRRLEKAGAQLVVWSEGSYPVTLPRDLSADFPPESLAMVRRGLAAPTLIGADTFESEERVFNSAVLFDQNGTATGRYDKVRLLAFGEYIPGADMFPWLKRFLPPSAGLLTAGAGPAVLPVQGPDGPWRLGTLICYEDLLAKYIRSVGDLHPHLLVNLTIDSWYGANSEPWQHLALSVFSTVELRAALVRSVNSGVSAMIDPNGRVLEKTYADDPYRHPRPTDGIVVSVPKMEGGHTLFVAWGDWFPKLCAAATLIVAVLVYRANRRVGVTR